MDEWMPEAEALSVLRATLEPLLVSAGFDRDGDRWTLRSQGAIRSVDFGVDFNHVVLRAGIGFTRALSLLRSAALPLDLSYHGVPATELLQLSLCYEPPEEDRHRVYRTGMTWGLQYVTAATLPESLRRTFEKHVLPFFKRAATVEGALSEVYNEHGGGECGRGPGPRPRINKFFLAAFYKERGERWLAEEVVEKELARTKPELAWPAFRDWILQP